ncbi:hypothetical protein UFOVP353_48 [uncultured Caudovirales phage]|jgi:hypothetical protein|uniref:Uncharacterized protein n=1 Tax=uncultured Caudovirales phage TaxID=2100421 RepID=A0A6J5LZ41_9CAUD|nr:hypothetical protein UFOVP353_48 [uncultured Caudovirales phage]
MLKKVAEYLKYPSTYKGLVALLSLAGVVVSPDQQEAVMAFGVAAYGLLSVFFSDSDVKKEG